MLKFIRDDFVIINDFSTHCRDLLHMAQNPRRGEITKMPERCHTFFTRHVSGNSSDIVEDNIILTYCQSIVDAFGRSPTLMGALMPMKSTSSAAWRI